MSTVPAPQVRRPPAGLVVQLGWEAILLLLLVVTAVLVFSLTRAEPNAFLLWQIASLGFIATGFALSLRTATPNLAVGAFAALAAMIYAKLATAEWPGIVAGLTAVLVVFAAGVVLGLLTGLSSAPGWAVSLVGLAGAQATILVMSDGLGLVVPSGGRRETWLGVLWLVAFVLVSLAEGALFLVPAARRLLGANRSAADAVEWRPARIVGAVVGLGGSSLLAGMSGIVLAEATRFAAPSLDLSRLLLAAGAALLGGVCVYGRRGGAVGTVFATVIIVLVTMWFAVSKGPFWLSLALAGVAILIGLGFSRLLEAVAGPE